MQKWRLCRFTPYLEGDKLPPQKPESPSGGLRRSDADMVDEIVFRLTHDGSIQPPGKPANQSNAHGRNCVLCFLVGLLLGAGVADYSALIYL